MPSDRLLQIHPHPHPGLDGELAAKIRAAVGRIQIRELEIAVRRTMVLEALRRSNGNRRAAARLLGVSRQHLQHMLRAIEPDNDASERVSSTACGDVLTGSRSS